MFEQQYLDDSVLQLRKLKGLADKALAQIQPADFFVALDPEANSIAVIMKHVAGNMRSRWTDFLTSDGEKPDRHRDTEFELGEADTREQILTVWEDGWSRALHAVSSLSPADLGKTVRDSRGSALRHGSDQPPDDPLRGARGADRAAREAPRRTAVAVAEHSAREIPGLRRLESRQPLRSAAVTLRLACLVARSGQ